MPINGRGPPVRGLWASDHFGLVCTFSLTAARGSGNTESVGQPKKLRMESVSVSGSSSGQTGPESRMSLKRPQCVISMDDDLNPALNRTSTVVTNRDGTRFEERRDPETGLVSREPLASEGQTCRRCEKDMGFRLQVRPSITITLKTGFENLMHSIRLCDVLCVFSLE
jgi:hypothetical protein